MGVDQGVGVPEGQGSMNPVAEATASLRGGVGEEAGGEAASRGTRTAYEAQAVWASLQGKAQPVLPRDGRGKRGGWAVKVGVLIRGDLSGVSGMATMPARSPSR